jgi:hypothetical protein
VQAARGTARAGAGDEAAADGGEEGGGGVEGEAVAAGADVGEVGLDGWRCGGRQPALSRAASPI